MKTILHPTDFSDSARRAVHLAVALAVSEKATLHIFHAVLLHATTPATEPPLDAYADAARQYGRQVLKQRQATDELKICTSHEHGVFGFEAIMEKATRLEPDLIVMGTHGRTGFSKLLMGSTAEKVLRHAPCSVLTVKADARLPRAGQFRRLLVPVDFSDWSRRALDAARTLAATAKASLHLLHVVEPIPPMYYAGNITSRFELDPDLRDRVEANLRKWASHIPGAKIRITEGSAAMEIARVAEDTRSDLVVMCTRGLTGLEHLLVGSVTERVCRFAPVPVLTIK